MKFALFSIKPKYVQSIINGEKTYELRKRKPNLLRGDQLIIYETSPEKRVSAIAELDTIIENDIPLLWQKVKNSCAVSHETFFDYFLGYEKGYALKLRNVRIFENPPSLADLRTEMPTYMPPQFFHFLNEDHPLFNLLTNIK